jgi:ASC-1-like (ASCH) protein
MGLKDIFPGAQPDHEPKSELTPEQQEALELVAKKVVEWRMAVPAIMTLETAKPLSFIGSQVLVFFEPIVKSVFSLKYYDTFRELMEDRENVERLLQLIEKLDAELQVKEKEYKKKLRAYLKKQTWGKRFWMWLTGRYPNLDKLNEELTKYGQMSSDDMK